MKRIWILMPVALLTACSDSNHMLLKRAAELCHYIPDHQLLEQSKDYMTDDFYAVLDTMFHMPESEPLAHEWLYYFVTGNGGTMANYTVTKVKQTDATHAVATILVRQQWEDGSFDETTDIEEHQLLMEKVGKQWLMADFDGHKTDCIRHIANHRRENAMRDAICNYLVHEIGPQYLQGDLCIPTLMIVACEEPDETHARVWCDCWVNWYRRDGDSLSFVSGGNHSGCLSLEKQTDGMLHVTDFEQTVDGAGNDASARRIFGPHYDIFLNIHSNPDVRKAALELQLQKHLARRGNASVE